MGEVLLRRAIIETLYKIGLWTIEDIKQYKVIYIPTQESF
jgi:hypothetical protein